MCLRSALVGFPGIIASIRRQKAILSLSRWRERVGVRVGLELYPLTFVLSRRGEEIKRQRVSGEIGGLKFEMRGWYPNE